jgi:hypothetical protein
MIRISLAKNTDVPCTPRSESSEVEAHHASATRKCHVWLRVTYSLSEVQKIMGWSYVNLCNPQYRSVPFWSGKQTLLALIFVTGVEVRCRMLVIVRTLTIIRPKFNLQYWLC